LYQKELKSVFIEHHHFIPADNQIKKFTMKESFMPATSNTFGNEEPIVHEPLLS
jgi:hypothetical protein